MDRHALIAELAVLIHELSTDQLDMAHAGARLAQIAEHAKGNAQLGLQVGGKSIAPPTKTEADDVQAVFAYWRQRTSKPKARLLPERIRFIKARLRQRFTVVQLKRVVDGAMNSPWHTGDNPDGRMYLGIETIFKDGSTVEKFLELADENGVAEEQSPSDAKVEQLRTEVRQAMEAKDERRYRRANDELRRVLQSHRQ